MTEFNNAAYSALVKDLLSDAFYLSGRSNRGIVATIRQYTEVLIRKILNLPEDSTVTVGDKKIIAALKVQSNENPLLLDSLKSIKEIGNKCTHTQTLGPVTDQDVTSCTLSLFNIYAYLFVSFFKNNKFGSNLEITTSFSILPPTIRYIALNYLYNEDMGNIMIIDKLSLSILKAFDENQAQSWLDQRREDLIVMASVTEEAAIDIEEKFGKEVAKSIVGNAPNMYDLCSGRVKEVANIIEEKGKLYYDFESAVELYKQEGIIRGDSAEIISFNDLMEFVYLGREARYNKALENIDDYLIMD